MAVTTGKMSTIVITLGAISFIFAVVAEYKKPSSGTPIQRNGVVICKYPNDPTVALGYLSFAFLMLSSLMGCVSTFYRYKGRHVPVAAIFKYRTFTFYFNLALVATALAGAMILAPTITELSHFKHNIQQMSANPECPTAKTGVLGGAAFLSLNASLFWFCSLMLLNNARDDYLQEPNPKC